MAGTYPCENMYFLGRDEAKVLEKKLRRQSAEQPGPKLVLYYNSGARSYIDAANAITASTGKFTEAILLFLWCIRDDAWNEKAVRTEGGAGLDIGDAQLVRTVGYLKRLDISSGPTRLSTYRRPSSLLSSSGGMRCWPQTETPASVACRTMIGWKSTTASSAVCWRKS